MLQRIEQYGYYFVAPPEWYKEWLRGFWETLEEPVLFIASDEPEKAVGDFLEYDPVTAKDLGAILPEADFFPDFYLLSQCDAVAISNSSFSFAACMLNQRARFFFRPLLGEKKLIPFDPWNSETIFRDEKALDHPTGTENESDYPKPYLNPGGQFSAPTEKDHRITIECPHCKESLYVSHKGHWDCPSCRNDFTV